MNKFNNAYKTIGEVVRIIGLKHNKGKLTPTHTIRFWEKEFKQIKPKNSMAIEDIMMKKILNY